MTASVVVIRRCVNVYRRGTYKLTFYASIYIYLYICYFLYLDKPPPDPAAPPLESCLAMPQLQLVAASQE